jgi:hypothetical protein
MEPEKSLRRIDPEAMLDLFRINAIGPALVAKHFMPLLDRERRSVAAFLSARVGSIGDIHLGGWISYRSSKGSAKPGRPNSRHRSLANIRILSSPRYTQGRFERTWRIHIPQVMSLSARVKLGRLFCDH